MPVYCPNKRCNNSQRPINRRVQAEVDVAIATKVLKMAFLDEYDMLIAITGDRDFKDCFLTIANESMKQVKICGFEDSIWQEYYDTRYGWEVYPAEYIWDRAIGKSLVHGLSKFQVVEHIPEVNIEQPRQSYNMKRNKAKKVRNAAHSNARSENGYYNPKNSRTKNKRKGKYASHKYARLDLNSVDDTKSACDINYSQSKYFDRIQDESKKTLINTLKVDDFTAELALFITDGNIEASKSFLTHK